MANEAYRAAWAAYQAAWEDVSPAERQELLKKSVSDNCVYTDPQGQTSSLAALIVYIEGFRQAMPGYSFKNQTFLEHHAQSLAEWTLYDASGAEAQPGSSWAHYGEDGRITNVSGFFAAPPDAG